MAWECCEFWSLVCFSFMNDFCKMFSFLSALPQSLFTPMSVAAVAAAATLFSDMSLYQYFHCGPLTIDQGTKGDTVAINKAGILCREPAPELRCWLCFTGRSLCKRCTGEQRKRGITPSCYQTSISAVKLWRQQL